MNETARLSVSANTDGEDDLPQRSSSLFTPSMLLEDPDLPALDDFRRGL